MIPHIPMSRTEHDLLKKQGFEIDALGHGTACINGVSFTTERLSLDGGKKIVTTFYANKKPFAKSTCRTVSKDMFMLCFAAMDRIIKKGIKVAGEVE